MVDGSWAYNVATCFCASAKSGNRRKTSMYVSVAGFVLTALRNERGLSHERRQIFGIRFQFLLHVGSRQP